MEQRSRYWLLFSLAFIALLAVWLFREPLRRRITQSATLSNPTPPPELVEEMISSSADVPAAIQAAWNTGKIVHRQAAMREISRGFPAGRALPPELEAIVLSGGMDVDMNVRETALGILESRKHSSLASVAAAQLQDPDPEVRLLGLHYLKMVDASIGVPTIIPLLEEDDPLIVTTALKLLERWTGQEFGVKLRDTAARENPSTGLKEFPEGSHEMARNGAAHAKAWWTAHRDEYPLTPLQAPRSLRATRKGLATEDFALQNLEGKAVRLGDLRGKVVLINFWTTWCSACLSEMPELIALQKRHGKDLAILGVSLDFVPDSHGHVGGHPAVEEQSGHSSEPTQKPNSVALQKVREKVSRTVKARGINYTVLLDEKNEIGGRFNGGELPTTVILDSDGNVRRRFIGARSLTVFEAMIAEAQRPDQ